MPNQTFKREKQSCLTCLVLSFLAGSGVWLKLILSDVLALQATHELLYEREFLTDVNWNVSRGLHITAEMASCDFKPPTYESRRLAPLSSADEVANAANRNKGGDGGSGAAALPRLPEAGAETREPWMQSATPVFKEEAAAATAR